MVFHFVSRQTWTGTSLWHRQTVKHIHKCLLWSKYTSNQNFHTNVKLVQLQILKTNLSLNSKMWHCQCSSLLHRMAEFTGLETHGNLTKLLSLSHVPYWYMPISIFCKSANIKLSITSVSVSAFAFKCIELDYDSKYVLHWL